MRLMEADHEEVRNAGSTYFLPFVYVFVLGAIYCARDVLVVAMYNRLMGMLTTCTSDDPSPAIGHKPAQLECVT